MELPINDVTIIPVPIIAIRLSRLSVPWVNERLPAAGLGGADVPRAAFPVLSRPSLRAVARSKVQLCRIPFSIKARRVVGSPSASKGLEPDTRARCGSSISDRPSGRTSSPIASFSQLEPRAIEPPLMAATRCPIRPDDMRSSNSTGKVPVGGFLGLARATARSPAMRPISAADGRSAPKMRPSPQ